MNKYEQLIEHIVNDDEDKARALFHNIVVERSREIYESLMQDEKSPSDDSVNNLVDEISADETGMHEDDMQEMDMVGDGMADDDMSGDMDMSMGQDDAAPATKSDIMDLESAIDELKAEFDKLMSSVDDDGDGDHDMDDHDMDDMDGMDDMDDESDDMDDESGDNDDDKKESQMAEAKKPKDAKDMKKKMSESERIREYVDRVGHDWDKNAQKGPKGDNVGTGDKSERQGEKNTKSVIDNMKNDMGGSNANMNRRGEEANPDGVTPSGKAGGFLKPAQEIDIAKRNVNRPGGNKGAQDYYNTKASAKTGEQGGTNAKSIESGK